MIEQLNPPHWKKRRTIDWKGGYEDTSYFLDFIEKNITPGIVVWINQKLFDEDYADEFFLEATGTSIFQLWELYQDTIPQEEESPEFSFETHKIDLERIKFKLIDTIPDSYGSILYNSIILNTPDFLKAQSSKIISLLYTDKCYPSYITSITLAIKDMDGVAHCENLTHSTRMISLSTNYIEKFFFSNKANQNLLADEIFGVVVHELTHAWQWATKLNAPTDNSKAPFGVIEGVADFVRLNSGYIPKHWNEEKSKSKTWDAGYETSGYFFYWIETRRPGFIVSMNEKVGRFGWRDELIKEICGRSADALWREYIGRKEIDEQVSWKGSMELQFL